MEVEDDASDGIVQAEEEEEEEEEANSEVDIFPTASTANRKHFPESGAKQNANQKRLLFGMCQVYCPLKTKQILGISVYLLHIFTSNFVFGIIVEGLRKQDLERHERFKGWQNSLFPSGNKKSDKKPQVNDF